jgi:malate/lactate dehydrogenase
MAVTHATATRSGIADYVTGLLNNGTIQFQTAASAVVATLTFGATAFGAASSGVSTANAITSDTDAAGNASPVTKAVIRSSAPANVLECSVGLSGEDINISKVVIDAGDTVELTSLTYTAAP